MAPPIKPFKRFIVSIMEVTEGDETPVAASTKYIEANGNPELFAKVGQFARQFSEDHIEEWRKKL